MMDVCCRIFGLTQKNIKFIRNNNNKILYLYKCYAKEMNARLYICVCLSMRVRELLSIIFLLLLLVFIFDGQTQNLFKNLLSPISSSLSHFLQTLLQLETNKKI
jgi:hypothetical protein